VESPDLEMRLPETPEECKVAAAGFRSISYKEAIANCVGVLDGYLLKINSPRKAEAKNVRAYYSGHYQCHGVNIQAVADHHCRFLYLAVAAPGSTGDNDAMSQISLASRIAKLPLGYCIIGDAAYTATEHLIPIYKGIDRLIKKNDDFNFYASQCRIRIEMAFGLMQMKWGILRQTVCSSGSGSSPIIVVNVVSSHIIVVNVVKVFLVLRIELKEFSRVVCTYNCFALIILVSFCTHQVRME
jgi:hypothetical protein